MNPIRRLFLIFAIPLLLVSVFELPADNIKKIEDNSFTIIYTGQVLGEIEPCG